VTEIIDDLYTRVIGYGTPFASALTCLRCGAMIDGGQYGPATARQVHASWHDRVDVVLARLAAEKTGIVGKPA
jgi:hypothetical protein